MIPRGAEPRKEGCTGVSQWAPGPGPCEGESLRKGGQGTEEPRAGTVSSCQRMATSIWHKPGSAVIENSQGQSVSAGKEGEEEEK